MGHGFGPGRCLVLWYSKRQEIATLSVYSTKSIAVPMAVIASTVMSILLLLPAIARSGKLQYSLLAATGNTTMTTLARYVITKEKKWRDHEWNK